MKLPPGVLNKTVREKAKEGYTIEFVEWPQFGYERVLVNEDEKLVTVANFKGTKALEELKGHILRWGGKIK